MHNLISSSTIILFTPAYVAISFGLQELSGLKTAIFHLTIWYAIATNEIKQPFPIPAVFKINNIKKCFLTWAENLD